MFRTSKTIVHDMVSKFVKALEEFSQTELLGAWCETTVEWEKSVGIAAMSKCTQGGSGSDFSDLTSAPRSGTDTLECMFMQTPTYQGFLWLDVIAAVWHLQAHLRLKVSSGLALAAGRRL
ncbi:hypothetical protein BGZ74_011414 [Mortierella antarctica]|nr:hypothetical protein BGZ74_011414 [Mortierella antarctica]